MVNHASCTVKLRKGENKLQFDGTDLSDSCGISIDNVKLSSTTNPNNLIAIANGGFELPGLKDWEFVYRSGGVLGRASVTAEVGDCILYNKDWPIGQ